MDPGDAFGKAGRGWGTRKGHPPWRVPFLWDVSQYLDDVKCGVSSQLLSVGVSPYARDVNAEKEGRPTHPVKGR